MLLECLSSIIRTALTKSFWLSINNTTTHLFHNEQQKKWEKLKKLIWINDEWHYSFERSLNNHIHICSLSHSFFLLSLSHSLLLPSSPPLLVLNIENYPNFEVQFEYSDRVTQFIQKMLAEIWKKMKQSLQNI